MIHAAIKKNVYGNHSVDPATTTNEHTESRKIKKKTKAKQHKNTLLVNQSFCLIEHNNPNVFIKPII